MKKKVVIFDLDGVIFDSAAIVSDYVMQTYPTMTREALEEILCGNFHEEFRKFRLTNNPIEETAEESDARRSMYSSKKAQTPLFEGIKEMLEGLHGSGHVLTINTSALEKNCLPLLENAKIKHLFDFIAAAELSKSKVEKFKIIVDRYGQPAEEMLFITDTLGDLREADIALIPTVAVTWGAHQTSHFEREPHGNLVAIIDSVGKLHNFIKEY